MHETVHGYYTSDADVRADDELQSFLSELETTGFARAEGGSAFRAAAFQTPEELVELLTTVIWVVSGRHAAVNFDQYSQMAFGPNYPLWMSELPPAKGVCASEEGTLRYGPTRAASVGQADTVWILSECVARGPRASGRLRERSRACEHASAARTDATTSRAPATTRRPARTGTARPT